MSEEESSKGNKNEVPQEEEEEEEKMEAVKNEEEQISEKAQENENKNLDSPKSSPKQNKSTDSPPPTIKIGAKAPTDNVAEIQHVRSELSAHVQLMQQQQEAKMHNLEAQLNEMEKKVQPEIQKLEHSQEEAKAQLDRVREKASALQVEDVQPLQRQYDQLRANFERFVRMDIEARMKPVQDDIRSSKGKILDLQTSMETSFARIDDTLKKTTEKIEEAQSSLKTQQAKVSQQLDEYIPKIGALEHKVRLLNNLLEDSPELGEGSMSLSAQLEKTNQVIQRLKEVTIPERIRESDQKFHEAIEQLENYCKDRIGKVQGSLNQLREESIKIAENRRKAEETMDHLLQSSDDAKERLKNLNDSIKTKLQKLTTDMNSSINGMNERTKDLDMEMSNLQTSEQAKIDDEVISRKKQVEISIRQTQEAMKKEFQAAEKEQNRAITKINDIKDALEGEYNCIGRVKDMEIKLKTTVDTIKNYNAARVTDNEKGGNPLLIHARLANIEKRLLAGEERLSKID